MKKLLFLLILLSLFLLAACGDNNNDDTNLPAIEQTDSVQQTDNSQQNNGSLSTSTFTVSGMNCRRCVTAIDTELSALSGVHSVSLDLRSGALIIEHELEVSIEEIKDIVILEGFSIE